MTRTVFFWLIVFICRPAFGVPDNTLIEVKYHPGEIYYIHNKTEVPCGPKKPGTVILGCARSDKDVEMKINMAQRHIVINVFAKNNEIEIHSDLPKGSCQYEEVLKHELTHIDLHSGALGTVVQKGMNDIVDAFNARFEQKDYNGAAQAAEKKFHEFAQTYYDEDMRQNQDFDRDDVDAIIRACKIPLNVEVVYNPPEIEYSSEAWIECPYRTGYCLQTSADDCDKLSFLSCMDFRLQSSAEFKLYLGRLSVKIDVPYFKIKILDDYLPQSCEYETLADYEFSLVDEIEKAVYDVVDHIKIDLQKAYDAALNSQYGTVDLNAEIHLIVQDYLKTMNSKISALKRQAKTITPAELKSKCAK